MTSSEPLDGRRRARAQTGAVDEHITSQGPYSGELDDSLGGRLLDRSHTSPPHESGALVARELAAIGARDIAIWMQDYDQRMLHPLDLPGQPAAVVEAVDGSLAGRAFALHTSVEMEEPGGRRIWLPLLDGTDRVGVLAFTLPDLDDVLRSYARRFAANVAHLFISKGMYTDAYFRLRRRGPLSLAAEIQWDLLPPLAISTPQVSVAGLLEPAYRIAGDSFDYAINADGLQFAIFDAMGHGLASAIMATTAISAYRHARRSGVPLREMYAMIDRVMGEQFGEDTFATAQLATLDLTTGDLTWVNAGHPAPLLVRGHKAVRFLDSPPALPVGFGSADPTVTAEQLEPEDLLLFFTDGVIEHRDEEGEMFGENRLAEQLLRHVSEQLPTAEVLRRLNRDLLDRVGPQGPDDDASLLLIHWHGPAEGAIDALG